MEQHEIAVEGDLEVGFEGEKVRSDTWKVLGEAGPFGRESCECAPSTSVFLRSRHCYDVHSDDTVRVVAEEIRPIRWKVSLFDDTTRVVFCSVRCLLGRGVMEFRGYTPA